MNTRALLLATMFGTLLQLAMVIIGHRSTAIAGLFGVGGMGFSFAAGIVYGYLAHGGSTASLALGGLVAGALCAFVGIFVSYLMKDVPLSLLALGTASGYSIRGTRPCWRANASFCCERTARSFVLR